MITWLYKIYIRQVKLTILKPQLLIEGAKGLCLSCPSCERSVDGKDDPVANPTRLPGPDQSRPNPLNIPTDHQDETAKETSPARCKRISYTTTMLQRDTMTICMANHDYYKRKKGNTSKTTQTCPMSSLLFCLPSSKFLISPESMRFTKGR